MLSTAKAVLARVTDKAPGTSVSLAELLEGARNYVTPAVQDTLTGPGAAAGAGPVEPVEDIGQQYLVTLAVVELAALLATLPAGERAAAAAHLCAEHLLELELGPDVLRSAAKRGLLIVEEDGSVRAAGVGAVLAEHIASSRRQVQWTLTGGAGDRHGALLLGESMNVIVAYPDGQSVSFMSSPPRWPLRELMFAQLGSYEQGAGAGATVECTAMMLSEQTSRTVHVLRRDGVWQAATATRGTHLVSVPVTGRGDVLELIDTHLNVTGPGPAHPPTDTLPDATSALPDSPGDAPAAADGAR